MDCKEKVKQKKSAGKEENVKRQRSFGKENYYENGVKRQEKSGKAKFGKATAKCGAMAKNHMGRTPCTAREGAQLRQKRATIPDKQPARQSERMRAGSARRENRRK